MINSDIECVMLRVETRNCEIHFVVVIVIGLWNANQCFVVLNILFLNFFLYIRFRGIGQ